MGTFIQNDMNVPEKLGNITTTMTVTSFSLETSAHFNCASDVHYDENFCPNSSFGNVKASGFMMIGCKQSCKWLKPKHWNLQPHADNDASYTFVK